MFKRFAKFAATVAVIQDASLPLPFLLLNSKRPGQKSGEAGEGGALYRRSRCWPDRVFSEQVGGGSRVRKGGFSRAASRHHSFGSALRRHEERHLERNRSMAVVYPRFCRHWCSSSTSQRSQKTFDCCCLTFADLLLAQLPSWLPMDTAAATITDLVRQQPQSTGKPRVTHVYNQSTETTWEDITGHLKETGIALGSSIEPSVWLQQLDSLGPDHPAKPLMGLWSASVSPSSLQMSSGANVFCSLARPPHQQNSGGR